MTRSSLIRIRTVAGMFRLRFILGFVLAMIVLAGGGRYGYAQEIKPIGELHAGDQTLVWIPSSGDTLSGPCREHELDPGLRSRLARIFRDRALHVETEDTPAGQISLQVLSLTGNQVRVDFFADSVSPSLAWWSSGRASHLAAGDVWFGDVFVFDAGVTVEGEIIGNLVVLGGDVNLAKGGAVRGDVIVIAGTLRQSQNTKVYGHVYAPGGHRRPRLIVPNAREIEERPYRLRPTVSYDRVDGFRAGVKGALRSPTGSTHSELWIGYAFASETWQYRLSILQQLSSSGLLEGRATLFRLTDTDDERTVGRNENTAFAIFAGSDYRDYYGADGGELALKMNYNEVGALTVTYRNIDYRPLEATPGLWHLFRRGHDFRPNFSTLRDTALSHDLDGRSSALLARLTIVPVESGEQPIGFNGSLTMTYEVAGGILGGAHDYDRFTIQGVGWWEAVRRHRLTLHLFYGAGRRDLPANKLFYAGGIGTLPAYPQKSFVGDESLIGGVEYQFTYWENPLGNAAIILFADFGRTTFDNDFWDPGDLDSDAGVGLDFGGTIRLDIARRFDRTQRDIRVTIQLSQSF